ncbi:MAG TPA: alpha/beta fold hydrolase, partial [Enterobacteriaceae bacterium]|nr:alpha/beta fold hydrolase [Enterobacteriaceae bacterium]
MTLHAVAQPGKPGLPWLVFLHGFSGDAREWQPVGARLNDSPRLYIDLPGHGQSVDFDVSDFAQVRQALRATLNSYNILNYWLIGYSMGGRIAMSWACEEAEPGLCGIVVEGGHPGLADEAARQD